MAKTSRRSFPVTDPEYCQAVLVVAILLKYCGSLKESAADLDPESHHEGYKETICMAQQIFAEATGLVGDWDL